MFCKSIDTLSARLGMAALLASTALVSPAFAQSSAEHDPAVCDQLVTYVEENDTDATGISRENAGTIARNGDLQVCDDALRTARGDISADENASNFDADAVARLQVVVPEPEVSVSQPAAEVTVEQPRPDVTVDPGRPVVTVTQAEPVVRVEIQQPRITIDMPKPQIVVEMPDPTVQVALAQPRVTVNQPAPTVNVEQGEVRLEVGEQQTAANTGEANVDVQREDAKVQVRQSEQARVNIAEVRPDVRYQAAEPRIEVQQSGEPEITFNQSGDADVQFRQLTADETRAEDNRLAAAQAGAAASDEPRQPPAGEAGARRFAVVSEAPPAESVGDNLQRVSADKLLSMTVIGSEGETIGDVEDLVIRDKAIFVIVGSGGFLGIGEKEVALPLRNMVMRGDELVMRQITEQDIEQMQDVEATDFQPFNDDSTEIEVSL